MYGGLVTTTSAHASKWRRQLRASASTVRTRSRTSAGCALHVPAQIDPRVLARLDEGYQGVWHLVGDGKADGSRARAQVCHPHRLAALGRAALMSCRAASIAT